MTTSTAPAHQGAPPKGRPIQWESIKLPAWLTGLIGGVAIIILWWMIATLYVTSTGAHPIPTPLEVVMSYIDSGWEYYWRNFSVTLAEAGIGYVWGNGIALFLAGLVLVIPGSRASSPSSRSSPTASRSSRSASSRSF
jgi:ABC-type nitrate/sulfonate/bicarbonate transport system permease component